jgi:hypothetical protein
MLEYLAYTPSSSQKHCVHPASLDNATLIIFRAPVSPDLVPIERRWERGALPEKSERWRKKDKSVRLIMWA